MKSFMLHVSNAVASVRILSPILTQTASIARIGLRLPSSRFVQLEGGSATLHPSSAERVGQISH